MPRSISNPNGKQLNKNLIKRRHTIGPIVQPNPLLNELLSTLMVPFRMPDGGDEEAPEMPQNRYDEEPMRPHPPAVSYDEDVLRSAEAMLPPQPHDETQTSGIDSALQSGERGFASVSASYQGQEESQEGNYSSSLSPMPLPIMPAASTAAGAASATANRRHEHEHGTPRHHTPNHPYQYPPQHHYGYPPQQHHPYPYDYSGYYHHHSEGDAGSNPWHHGWQPEHFHNHPQSHQDYTHHHSYYASSPANSYPPHPHHDPRPQFARDDAYSSQGRHSRPPHSAPPSYNRGGAYGLSSRSTPPIQARQEPKHPSSYKETPSAITEGTTPSKQSPPLELSPEMSQLFDGQSDDERKPAANTETENSQGMVIHPRQEQQEISPRSDDFEPIPFSQPSWSQMPRDAVASEGHYRYPVAAAAPAHREDYPPPLPHQYAVDPSHVGLPSHHYFPPAPARSSAAPAAAIPPRQEHTTAALSTGGEGSSWEKRFAELLDFRARHGHCEVPQNFKENTSLGIWVNKQRMEQKNRIEGKNSSLNDARLRRLEAVGFRWAKRKGQVSWDEKFDELKAYKRKHGNCHVPTKYKENTALGRWVSTQRAEYKKYCEGDEKTSMTAEKIQRLEGIGFAWFMAL